MSPPRARLLAGFIFSISWSLAAAAIQPVDVAPRLEKLTTHPRLFLPAGGEAGLKQRIAADPLWQNLQAGLLREADRELATKPVARVLIGRRLLDKSRTALSRVLHLAFAWRLTGERKYLDRARAELVAVAAFPDWNPSHFLDVAEMTTAVAIGYDWLYPALDESTRAALRAAIVQKGLMASRTANSWTKNTNNWNQVCNGGMTIGALAVAESEPALATEMIVRALNSVPLAMHEFSPDGAYPEGPGYWGYGTTFNVLLVTALQSTLGTDFGLTQQPGFLATADYYLHVIGPTGYYFNYSDCGRGGHRVEPAMFWLAAQRQQSYLLWNEWPKIVGASARRGGGRDRTDPMLLLWTAPNQAKPTQPPALSWTARGPTPVAFHRSSWTPDASYVAIKGGSPANSHAHMDVGTFVMESDGVRWADDLGSQEYHSLESKGVDLWNRKQDSDRWRVFRIGTSAHNVLMVDGQPQRVEGQAPIISGKAGRTVVDTSGVYQGQLAKALRGVALAADRTVLVQDEVTTLGKTANVRWAMVTRAQVTIDGSGRATLTENGKKLRLQVVEPASAVLKTYPTNPPPSATDASNEGTQLIGFEVSVPANQTQRLVVQLVPASATADKLTVQPLSEW